MYHAERLAGVWSGPTRSRLRAGCGPSSFSSQLRLTPAQTRPEEAPCTLWTSEALGSKARQPSDRASTHGAPHRQTSRPARRIDLGSLIASLIHPRTPASIGVYRCSLSRQIDHHGRTCTVNRTTEKRKVGGSTPPLTTNLSDLRKRDQRNSGAPSARCAQRLLSFSLGNGS